MNGPGLAMNSAAGGPVGAPPMNAQPIKDFKMDLNTYIYDHLKRTGQFDLAKEFKAHNPCKTKAKGKPNGISNMDGKANQPDDLPDADVLPFHGDSSFLMDWWTMFWDLFFSARTQAPNGTSQAYLQQQRMRHQMMSGDPKMRGMTNMMMGGKQMIGARNMTPQLMQQQKMMAGQQMQRDSSNMEMGVQGPQTPGNTMDNAPSPSKRPRLDNGAFEAGGMPGRQPVNQMAMAANGQLMQGGMTAQQMNAFGPGANGQLKMEGMNGMPPNAMAQAGMEGEFAGQPMAGSADNKHALQDYQMQLMLLEQQNKKRLLAAKRDNPESMSGGAPPAGFQQAPNMSPSGSRGAGPSPTPNDQMRKVAGTPKLAQQMPGSPMADIQNRASPAPNFDPANPQMQHGMPQQFYQNMNGNQLARPPSSHPNFTMNMNPQQLEQMRLATVARGQPWPPGGPQMMPNMPSQQTAAMVNAQQRPGTMAPPPVPADQNQPQQRTQPSSPAQNPAPPTPSTKAAPKPKKEQASAKKKTQNKKNAGAAATPAAESEPTPTPSTPITNAQFGKQAAPTGPTNAQSQPAAAPATQPAMDAGSSISFGMEDGGLNNTPGGFSLEFQGLDGSDVFENFDFDNFLNADGAEMGMDTMSFPGDGVEAGAGNV